MQSAERSATFAHMTTCGTCGNVTDEAICPVDGTRLAAPFSATIVLEVEPRMPEGTIALVSDTEAVVVEIAPAAKKHSRRKS